ncbi:hypothetical protein LRP49_00625 [Enterovibrio sp. ZSDZ35]|uniref:Uncharacterized protein n=1 Tax=Enterovibrio qingdaonensis TaxID=2899818 RepID=A0ABT5QGR4_9GAMM|nr:hypothetical protein [Enterovibrio sp. ZSDZ35]MDD1779685.1 hypothetical protein [Enterovibrio sp. ZSDZ35]
MKWILSDWIRKKKYEKFFNRVEEDFFKNKKYRPYLEDRILSTLKNSAEQKPKRATRIVLGCIRLSLLDKYLIENRYIRFLEDNSKELCNQCVSGSDVTYDPEGLIENFIHNKHRECSDYILSHIPKYYKKVAKELDVELSYTVNKHGESEMHEDMIMILCHKKSDT